MNLIISLIAVIALVVIGLIGGIGGSALNTLFGVVIPYVAILVFIIGLIWRMVNWARSAVPFKIPTTCGQQKSLDFIKAEKLEAPCCVWSMLGRMALEVLLFRSLFRNTKAEVKTDGNLAYGESIWLWLAALAFHYSFLVIFLRHFRLFVEPIPFFVTMLEFGDGFFEIGVPFLFLSDLVLLAAATYLLLRRVFIPQVRFISLASDYFALFLILAIATTGVLMRHFIKVDLLSAKQLIVGLFSLRPVVPAGIGAIFFIHIFMVSMLLLYFPFSKLVHAPGVFFSPTRNMINNNRAVRHVNPWDYPVKVHTYAEWEEEFHDLMKDAGMPLEKE